MLSIITYKWGFIIMPEVRVKATQHSHRLRYKDYFVPLPEVSATSCLKLTGSAPEGVAVLSPKSSPHCLFDNKVLLLN